MLVPQFLFCLYIDTPKQLGISNTPSCLGVICGEKRLAGQNLVHWGLSVIKANVPGNTGPLRPPAGTGPNFAETIKTR